MNVIQREGVTWEVFELLSGSEVAGYIAWSREPAVRTRKVGIFRRVAEEVDLLTWRADILADPDRHPATLFSMILSTPYVRSMTRSSRVKSSTADSHRAFRGSLRGLAFKGSTLFHGPTQLGL